MYRVLLASLAAAVLLAGCSSEKTLSQDDITSKITSQYQEQTGAELTDITCADVKAEVGAALSCEASNANGMKLTIGGKVTATGDGEDNRFEWKVTAAKVPSGDFESAATRMIVQQMKEDAESVECPEMIEMKAGNEIDCAANMADGSTRDITLKLTDTQGAFQIIPR